MGGGSHDAWLYSCSRQSSKQEQEGKGKVSQQNKMRTRKLTAGGRFFLSKGVTRQDDGTSSFSVSLVKDLTVFSSSLVDRSSLETLVGSFLLA
jgi:hypothetical protein